jgi:hypothetical protein
MRMRDKANAKAFQLQYSDFSLYRDVGSLWWTITIKPHHRGTENTEVTQRETEIRALRIGNSRSLPVSALAPGEEGGLTGAQPG